VLTEKKREKLSDNAKNNTAVASASSNNNNNNYYYYYYYYYNFTAKTLITFSATQAECIRLQCQFRLQEILILSSSLRVSSDS